MLKLEKMDQNHERILSIILLKNDLQMIMNYDQKQYKYQAQNIVSLDIPMLQKKILVFIRLTEVVPIAICIAIDGIVSNNQIQDCEFVHLIGAKSSCFELTNTPCCICSLSDVAVASCQSHFPKDFLCVSINIGYHLTMSISKNGEYYVGKNGYSPLLDYVTFIAKNGFNTARAKCTESSLMSVEFSFDVVQQLSSETNNMVSTRVDIASSYFGLILAMVLNLFKPNVIQLSGRSLHIYNYYSQSIYIAKQYTTVPFHFSNTINGFTEKTLLSEECKIMLSKSDHDCYFLYLLNSIGVIRIEDPAIMQ